MNYDFLHIGLVGIYNYKEFWKNADNIIENKPLDSTIGDVDVLKKLYLIIILKSLIVKIGLI